MSLSRILSSIVAIVLMIGLFMAAFSVFAIVVVVLLALGAVQWLRNKGIIAQKKSAFKTYGDEPAAPSSTHAPVIEGEFEKIEESKQ